MNHLEQLVSEWLQYKGYFVRVSIPVGPRPLGGFEGELDVVAVHPGRRHLIHVECSLDALSDAQRQPRFAAKFERGRKFVPEVLKGLDLPGEIDQVAVLQFASGRVRNIGGARLVTVRELVVEIRQGLAGTSPASGAISANLPLLRTLQLAADAFDRPAGQAPGLVGTARGSSAWRGSVNRLQLSVPSHWMDSMP